MGTYSTIFHNTLANEATNVQTKLVRSGRELIDRFYGKPRPSQKGRSREAR